MKKIVIGLMALMFVQTSANAFDWNNLYNFLIFERAQKAPVVTTTQSAVTNEFTKALSDLQTQAATVDSSVQSTFLSLVSTIETKKEAKTIKSKINSIQSDKNKTDAEKTLAICEVMSDYVSELNADESLVNEIKGLSDSDKKKLASYISSLNESGQKYIQLAKNGLAVSSTAMKTATTASEVATVISNINSYANDLKKRSVPVINLVNKMRTAAQLAELVIPASGN